MGVVKQVKRFEVWLVTLDPTHGSEIRKTRPCLIVSPDEMNGWLRTIIAAPMTTAERSYPTRIAIRFNRKDGQVALDQMRCMDKTRLIKRLGKVPEDVCRAVSDTLVEMFAI